LAKFGASFPLQTLNLGLS